MTWFFFSLRILGAVTHLFDIKQLNEAHGVGTRDKSVCPVSSLQVFSDRLVTQQSPVGTSLKQNTPNCQRVGDLRQKKQDLWLTATWSNLSKCYLCHTVNRSVPFYTHWGHIGNKWSSLSSGSSSRGFVGTSLYPEASSRLRDRHTKSQPSWKGFVRHVDKFSACTGASLVKENFCNLLQSDFQPPPRMHSLGTAPDLWLRLSAAGRGSLQWGKQTEDRSRWKRRGPSITDLFY